MIFAYSPLHHQVCCFFLNDHSGCETSYHFPKMTMRYHFSNSFRILATHNHMVTYGPYFSIIPNNSQEIVAGTTHSMFSNFKTLGSHDLPVGQTSGYYPTDVLQWFRSLEYHRISQRYQRLDMSWCFYPLVNVYIFVYISMHRFTKLLMGKLTSCRLGHVQNRYVTVITRGYSH